MTIAKPAIVLSSGGLDSTTVLAIAREAGFAIYALSFDYGQRHRFELEAAARAAEAYGAVRHEVVSFNLGQFGGSALTADIDVPKHANASEVGLDGIPVTYVPARNTIFLSFALGWADVLGARDIFIGVNALDYSGYPDCRQEFISAFERTANLATKTGVESEANEEAPILIHAPLIHMTKAGIIKKGLELGVDYGLTHSCYDPSPTGAACGHCDACLLRLKGFEEAGAKDPVKYQ